MSTALYEAPDPFLVLRGKGAMELRRRRKVAADDIAATVAAGWRIWLRRRFPNAVSKAFALRHERLWTWFDALRPGVVPKRPDQVEVWPRGGGKSSTAELGVTYVGSQYRRRFVLYVCGTQNQSNKHVGAIAAHFATLGLERATSPYGSSLGWRVDMLRVVGGFNVVGLGLDAAARGVKLDDYRPDLIIFDDIDDRHDTEKTLAKKITTITETLLPTGAPDCATLVIQNLVHRRSIVSRLVDRTAEFLHGAEVHQEPALHDFDPKMHLQSEVQPDGTRRYAIVGGLPTWEGQDVATCVHQINRWGRSAFLREAQHDMTEVAGGLWARARDIDPWRLDSKAVPELIRITVAIDPNAEGGDGNDPCGIMVGGVDRRGHGYLLADETEAGGPALWKKAAVDAYVRWKANRMVAEKNNGGQMVAITLGTEPGAPRVHLVSASRGKLTRAEPVQMRAEEGRIHHVGVFPALEDELCAWTPGDPSPNRLDAYVWLITDLLGLKAIPDTAHTPWFPGQESAASNGHSVPVVRRNGHATMVRI